MKDPIKELQMKLHKVIYKPVKRVIYHNKFHHLLIMIL